MTGNKAVMISIQPEWCGYIFDERKMDEVRKNTPDMQCPFKVYIYCTKHGDKTNLYRLYGINETRQMVGKVCAEFICDHFTCIQARKEGPNDYHLGNTAFLRTQLTASEIFYYLAGDQMEQETFDVGGWAWHISDLIIYADPKDLDCFKMWYKDERVKRPPQSWCYVKEL